MGMQTTQGQVWVPASSACLFCTVGHSALPSSGRYEVLFAPRLVASRGADFSLLETHVISLETHSTNFSLGLKSHLLLRWNSEQRTVLRYISAAWEAHRFTLMPRKPFLFTPFY